MSLEDMTRRINIQADECWEWSGNKSASGYGLLTIKGSRRVVHRVLYELLVGPIPDGLQLDHLCRNRLCVNPDHLEPVTQRENVLRGEHPSAVTYRTGVCGRGHSMEDARVNAKTGHRNCRTCYNENRRRRRREGSGE